MTEQLPANSSDAWGLAWLDQDLCVGCGLCAEVAPDVFQLGKNGTSEVHLGGVAIGSDGEPLEEGSFDLTGRAISHSEIAEVVLAAKQCPGEIIILEEGASSFKS